jgi:hypothetical protein
MRKTNDSDKISLRKIQFFHTWLFYYLYSADHKFMKSLLKQKFSKQEKNKFKFPHVLFAKEMYLLATHKFSQVKTVYGKKTYDALKKEYCPKDIYKAKDLQAQMQQKRNRIDTKMD